MKSIQIRDVPDDVHARLRSKAALSGVSLSEFLLREATKVADRSDLADVLQRAVDRDWGVSERTLADALAQERADSDAA